MDCLWVGNTSDCNISLSLIFKETAHRKNDCVKSCPKCLYVEFLQNSGIAHKDSNFSGCPCLSMENKYMYTKDGFCLVFQCLE